MNPFDLDYAAPIKKFLKEIIQDFFNAAFKWLEIYMLKPTAFTKGYVDDVHGWMLTIAIPLCSLFIVYHVVKFYFVSLSGNTGRPPQELIVRMIIGVAVAASSPAIMVNGLLHLNNLYVKAVLKSGIDVSTLSDMMLHPKLDTVSASLAAFALCVCYLVLACQYIIRQGELIVLFIGSPIAGVTIVNDEMNIFPIWWREVISTIFAQGIQLTILYIILNKFGNGSSLNDYLAAIGLLIVLIMGPKYLRTFLYSTGSGKSIVGAASGVGKFAIYKHASSRVRLPIKPAA